MDERAKRLMKKAEKFFAARFEGRARAAALSPKRRTEIARKAAATRWGRLTAEARSQATAPAVKAAALAKKAKRRRKGGQVVKEGWVGCR